MCGGVKYILDGEHITTHFPQPGARLPVRSGGQIRLVTWGRREGEGGHLPITGWARQESIDAGKWQRYVPTLVPIKVTAIMEKDKAHQSHWYPVHDTHYMQGLLVDLNGEVRVYVVTVEGTPPPGTDMGAAAVHDRWPLFRWEEPNLGFTN